MSDAAGAKTPDGGGKVSAYSWYTLGVLVIVYTLNFIDRQIMSILAEDIRIDLNLSDADLGFLYGTAFAIFYTVLGIPLGRLADTWYRGRLMALGLALWSGMTVVSGLASNYAQLAAARIGVGVGEASASPAAFSMLSARFPVDKRALAYAIYSSGVYLGMGLSLPIGGWISTGWENAYPTGAPFDLAGWQVTFFAVGAPGLLVALWVLTLREPPRLGPDGSPQPVAMPGAWRAFLMDLAAVVPPFTLWRASRFKGALLNNIIGLGAIGAAAVSMAMATSDWAQWMAYGVGCYCIYSWAQTLRHTDTPAYKLIWAQPAIPLAIIGFGSLAVTTYAFGFWAAPYAMRTFGASAAEAGAFLGIPGAFASALGVIFGGRLSDFWKKRDPRGRIFTCMLAAALSAPAMLVMFLAPNLQVYLWLSPLVFFTANLWAGSAVATYQDFVLPRMYGTIGAIYLLGSTMIGLAIGPYASGKIATVTGSLQLGVFSLLAAPVVALIALWLLTRLAGKAEASKYAVAQAAGEPKLTMPGSAE